MSNVSTSSPSRVGGLHGEPPATPRGVLFALPGLVWVLATLSALLALLAAVDGGSVLLTWDEPIQRWVEAERTDGWDTVFRTFSRLGSNVFVFGVFVVLAAFTLRRCRALALALLVAVAARPAFEFVMKELVGRERPDLEPLVDGVGPSHPSGHVLAAVALWGLLPPIVALVTDRRWIWWSTAVISGVVIVGVAASRVYLGVHWFSDVVQSLLLGVIYLAVVEMVFVRSHERLGCAPTPARE